jgi:murein DD-endopeptidase MepM/ murein hydrolase activator NlpD
MVWKLRAWAGGDPAAQVAMAKRLGLSSVSVKVQNGTVRRWENPENYPHNQNWDLMASTVRALVAAGIEVTGWGWLYGRAADNETYKLDADLSLMEATATADIMRDFVALGGAPVFGVDAEAPYKEVYPERTGMAGVADRYFDRLYSLWPDLILYLCTYRYPTLHQTFPFPRFISGVHSNAPQVYWLGETAVDAGARNLSRSLNEYNAYRWMETVPMAPTYSGPSGWRASPAQLIAFFAAAKANPQCVGAGVWCLDLATAAQLDAVAQAPWDDTPPAPVPPPAEEFRLAWPTMAPKVVTQAYGINPYLYNPYGLKGHEGIDLRAPNGTPVYAAADGVVSRVEPIDNNAYGVHVRLKHLHGTDEYETVYGHFTVGSIRVVVGLAVARGQLIGLADDTGNSSAAHLHMTLKHRGHGSPWMAKSDIVNPTPYMVDLFPGKGWIVDVAGNLRTGPDLGASIKRLLPVNTLVDALDFGGEGGDWWEVRVRATGESGYYWNPGYKLRAVL